MKVMLNILLVSMIKFSIDKVVFELITYICCDSNSNCVLIKIYPREIPCNVLLLTGSKDIKSSLRGAKLPNGQPMLLDEEQNSLALLIEQVESRDEPVYNGYIMTV